MSDSNKTEMLVYSTGRLLETKTTKEWPESARERADHDERCLVFHSFTEEDQGKGRVFVAKCHDPLQALHLAKLLNDGEQAMRAVRDVYEAASLEFHAKARLIDQERQSRGAVARCREVWEQFRA